MLIEAFQSYVSKCLNHTHVKWDYPVYEFMIFVGVPTVVVKVYVWRGF